MHKTGRPVRVLIVDDHALVRKQLHELLRSYPDIEVVGEAGDGQEAVSRCAELAIDVLVMDINMPKLNGIEATRLIKNAYPQMTVIGLSVNAGLSMASLMKEAGSHMVLGKENAADELPKAIQQCAMLQISCLESATLHIPSAMASRREGHVSLSDLQGMSSTAERTFTSDAPLQQDLRETLREVSRAAQSMRVLADYLERHPEAILRGKKEHKP